jgi:fibronectin type 3 domain-containing protein
VRALVVSLGWLLLTGCGYVGPVLPPSPQIPNQVTDLSVVERGDKILIAFQTPPRTTDNLSIKRFSEIDLRIGPAPAPFDFDRWSATAKQYLVAVPPAGDPDDPQPIPLSETIPASAWQGQHVAVAVRTAVRKGDHYSSWSNRVVLDVVAPLTAPVLEQPKATAQGVLLNWEGVSADVHYRVYRQATADKQPVDLGTADQPTFLDSTAQYDTKYEYTVIVTQGLAESLPSQPAPITPEDKFAPSVPASITALSGPESIEVSWQRSPESDLQGYFVYRSVNGSPFERQAELVTLPTYSDRHVERGKTYRYEVSAVDKKNNESGKSAPAEANF